MLKLYGLTLIGYDEKQVVQTNFSIMKLKYETKGDIDH